MRLNLSFAHAFAVLASVFLIIIPLVTLIRYFDNAEILKVAVLLLLNLISIIIFLKSIIIKLPNKIKILEFSHFRLSILSLICLLPLLFFVWTSMQGSSLIEIAIFSERYRQGEYSGSGIYTSWSTQILSLIVFVILINNGPSKSLVIPTLVVIFASLTLGLRVFLWGIFVGYFLSLLKYVNVKKILFVVTFALLFFLYKYLLNPVEDVAFNELVIGQLTRPDLHAIVKYEIFSENIFDMFEYFPYVRHLFGHDMASFKDFYIPAIPNLTTLMPYVSLYSGVALPGYVIVYNTLFVLALFPCIIILSSLYNLLVLVCKTKKVFIKFLCSYFFLVLSLTFFEDVNVLYKVELEIVYIFISYILYLFVSKKTIND